jgi:hypothetical protein
MRYTALLPLALAAGLLLPGCGPEASSTAAPSSQTSIATAKLKDAAAAAEAAKAKRDEFVGAMSKQLDELNVKYEELKILAGQAEGRAKDDLDQKLAEAKIKRDAAATKLAELKEAGADRWESFKGGVENALSELQTETEKFAATTSGKVEDAAAATTAAARAKRDEFAGEMTRRLDALNVKYDDLKDRAARAGGQVQEDLQQQLAEVKVKRDAAAKKLDELKQATADRWEKLKQGVGNAVDDLKTALQ